MIALYARQSVDKPDSISISQQLELCRYESRGAPCRCFADRGYSGKNTERPAFGEMMAAVAAGQIRTVIVYKLDRISRSVLDFARMMQQFEQQGVQFISATEKFDTGSPMGRAMLNICIVFAQLERETIQKRVADAYAARSDRGLYMGGPVPFGFRRIPAVLGGVHTSVYVPEPEEAAQLSLIYRLYADPAVSLGEVAARLRAEGMQKRGRDWERARIREVLRNPVYVQADRQVYAFFAARGAQLVNPQSDYIGENGCYCYKNREASGDGGCLRNRRIVLAPHRGLIPADLWLACQQKNTEAPTVRHGDDFWLSGLLYCGACGSGLTAKQGSRGRYLYCARRLHKGACSGIGTLEAGALEQAVEQLVLDRLNGLGTLYGETLPDSALTGLEHALTETEQELAALLEKLPQADAALFSYINSRVTELHLRRTQLEGQLAEQTAKASGQGILPDAALWHGMSPADRRRAAGVLIRRVEADPEQITIYWRL